MVNDQDSEMEIFHLSRVVKFNLDIGSNGIQNSCFARCETIMRKRKKALREDELKTIRGRGSRFYTFGE